MCFKVYFDIYFYVLEDVKFIFFSGLFLKPTVVTEVIIFPGKKITTVGEKYC